MNNSLVGKYYLKKQNEVIDYAKQLTKLITAPEYDINNDIISDIIKILYRDFYFDSDSTNQVITKYYDNDISSLIDNKVLASVISIYLKKKKNIVNNSELLVYSIICSLASLISEYSNPFIKDNIKISDYIDAKINDIKKLDYIVINDKEKNVINDIIKSNKKYLTIYKKYIKSFNSTISYNTFKDLTKESKYYLVTYMYIIDELSRFRRRDVQKYYNRKFDESLFFISCNLLSVTILKEIICNNKGKRYVLRLEPTIYKNNKNIDKLELLFFNAKFKEYLSLLVNENDYISDINVINRFRNKGFDIIVNSKNSDDISSSIKKINENDTILISTEQNKKNQTYLEFMKEKGINILVENKSNRVMKNNF